jgi:hypothetical protein
MFIQFDTRAAPSRPRCPTQVMTCFAAAAIAVVSSSCAPSAPEEQAPAADSVMAPNREKILRNEGFHAEAEQLRDDQRKARAEGERELKARTKEFEREGY